MLRKRLHIGLLGSLLAAAFVAAVASPASAGTYNVNSCGKSSTGSLSGWTFDATAGAGGWANYFFTAQVCDGYGIYRGFQNVMIPAGAYAAWTFHAPADTYIRKATLYGTSHFRAPGAYDAVIAERADGSRTLLGNVVGTGDVNAAQSDPAYDVPASASPAVGLRTELGCQPANNCNPQWGGQNGNEWNIVGSVIELGDPSTPTFTSVGGDGWAATPADGVDPITYTVADTGAGMSEVKYYLDGIQYGSNASSCTPGTLVPCSLSDHGQFVLDTTKLSEGPHTVSLVAVDYAGNASAQTDKQLTVTVRRAPQSTGSTPVTTSNPSWNGGGSPAVGDHLSGSAGSWSGTNNTYTYQWQRCDSQGVNCDPIDGANGLGYTPTSADVGHTLVFCVTATNSGGSATSCSSPTPAVVAVHPTTATTDRPADATPASPGGSYTLVGSGTSSQNHGAPNGSPASEKVVLTAYSSSRTSTQKVKFGKRVPISGRLVGPSGAPIAGATLSVQMQTALPGASMADAAQVATDKDGRFTYVAPAGPSRVIRFGYRTYTSDTSFADTTDVHLLVAAGVTMKATPKKVRNRHATVFTGRLLGKPLAKRGVVVDLQVFFRKQWRTFAAPRTNRRGVYKFKYRFMAGAATWRFRARVRRVSEYPYEVGLSVKPVRVKVVR